MGILDAPPARLVLPLAGTRGNGTTVDTAAINAALAAAPAGAVVRGIPGRNYLIDAPLVTRAGGRQTLDMTGCTITLKAGSSCNMLTNAAVTAAGTAADGAITSGQTTLTTTLAAQAQVGQSVTVSGAGSAAPTVLTAVVTAATATDITLSVAARATVTGATVKLFPRDAGIRVIGGTWVRGANDGAGVGLHTMLFRHLDDLIVDPEAITSSAGKYAISIADATNVWVRARNLAVSSDGVHLMGPITGARIEEVTGSTGDDTFAITAADWTAYGDTSGDVTDISIGRIRATTNANLLKVIAGAGCRVDRVKVTDGVYGTATLNGAWIGNDVAQAATTGGTYGHIDLGVVDGTYGQKIVRVIAPNAEYIRVRPRGTQSTALAAGVVVEGTGTATIDVLHIDGGVLDASTSAANALLVLAGANITIGEVVLDACRVVGYTTSILGNLVWTQSGAIGTLNILNCLGKFSATVGYFAWINGATVGAVNFIGGGTSNGATALRRDGTSTGALTVTMTAFRVLGHSRVADCRVGTTTFKFNGPAFESITLAAFFTNAGTLIFDGSISTVGTFTMLQRQATESVRSLGVSLPFDVSMLAKVNGDAAYNTNATLACGAGRVITDGANWKNLFTAATY